MHGIIDLIVIFKKILFFQKLSGLTRQVDSNNERLAVFVNGRCSRLTGTDCISIYFGPSWSFYCCVVLYKSFQTVSFPSLPPQAIHPLGPEQSTQVNPSRWNLEDTAQALFLGTSCWLCQTSSLITKSVTRKICGEELWLYLNVLWHCRG